MGDEDCDWKSRD